jgi:HEAT repeat protein
LAAAPKDSIPFLKNCLKPIASPSRKRIAQLIANLASDDFDRRDEASKELEYLRETAASALKIAAQNSTDLEVRRRAEHTLKQISSFKVSRTLLREFRALEALEQMGTNEAGLLIQNLAKGASEVRLTQDAIATLKRMKTRNDIGGQ